MPVAGLHRLFLQCKRTIERIPVFLADLRRRESERWHEATGMGEGDADSESEELTRTPPDSSTLDRMIAERSEEARIASERETSTRKDRD